MLKVMQEAMLKASLDQEVILDVKAMLDAINIRKIFILYEYLLSCINIIKMVK